MFDLYFHKLKEQLNIIEKDEKENIIRAATEVARCVRQNGIIHVFGCGHSHMLGEELFYRAGGLAPINPIFIEDLMLHKGAVKSSQMEKTNNLVHPFMKDVQIDEHDVVIVVSTSGRNPVPVDVAEIARGKGAFVIGITSLVYATSVSSRHKDGKYLHQVVNLAIDNHVSIGDAMMTHESLEVPFGSGSTVIGAAIVNGIMVEAIDIMLANNIVPPVFKSGNADKAEEHNRALIERYKNRIPLLEG